MKGLLYLSLFFVAGATVSGCAGRLSPHLHGPPESTGLVVLECYYYPVDPEGVRSTYAAPDSFPARSAYLETMDGSRHVRGLSSYGTGFVIFSGVPPGTYRLARVDLETNEYSSQLARELKTDVTFHLPPETFGDTVLVEAGRPVYVGRLAILRPYRYEDVARTPKQEGRKEDGNVDLTIRKLDQEEARAWRTLLKRKSYRKSSWGAAMQKRLSEVEKS
jgi:hypothetical protein